MRLEELFKDNWSEQSEKDINKVFLSGVKATFWYMTFPDGVYLYVVNGLKS